MGTGNSQKITLRHQGNLTACEKGREEVFRRRTPSWIFCDGSVRRWQTWCRIIRRHLRCPLKTASSCRGGWAGGAAARPEHPHGSRAEAGRGPGPVPQPLTAFLSHPPASPIPALRSQPGKAAGVSCTRAKQQPWASCSPHASAVPGHGRVLLSPPLRAARRQGVNWGAWRGKSVKCNVAATGVVKCGLTWAELHGWFLLWAEPGRQSRGAACLNVSSVPDWKRKSQSGAGERLLNSK